MNLHAQVLVDLLLDEGRSRRVHSHTLRLLLRVLVTDDIKLTIIQLGIIPAIIRLLGSDHLRTVQRSLTVLTACTTVEVPHTHLTSFFIR
jgi:hypothetical protein